MIITNSKINLKFYIFDNAFYVITKKNNIFVYLNDNQINELNKLLNLVEIKKKLFNNDSNKDNENSIKKEDKKIQNKNLCKLCNQKKICGCDNE